MTTTQRVLRSAAYQIGRRFGTGGRAWIAIVPGGGDNARVYTAEAAIDLFIVENNLVRVMNALPQTAIYSAPWWGIGGAALAPDTVLLSASDPTWCFVVTGAADQSQGFRLTPLALAQTPLRAAAPRLLRQGVGAGLRTGM